MEHMLLYIILAIVILEYVLSNTLSWLNIKSWKPELPEQLKEYYDAEQYKKAYRYAKENNRISFISGLLSLIATLFVLIFGVFGWLDGIVTSISQNLIVQTLLFFGILGLASTIVGLPFGIYKTFVIEEKYGFNKTTPSTFIGDLIKGLVLGGVIGGILIALFVWFYEATGTYFWLYGWLLFMGFSLFFMIFYRSLIVPIFNKLTPLEEGELRTAIQDYASKVKFPLTNIFVMDASKRSTKSNAYFSGLGSKKSIVLFDTLIKDHTKEELVAVLAHEVGHYKKKHVLQSFIISGFTMLVTLYLLGLFIDTPELSLALGAGAQKFYINLIAFGLLYSPISMVTGILTNIFSRKNEFEADAFAKETYAGKPLGESLIKMSVKHLSNLSPHPAFVFFHYSHPPLLQRLKALET